MSLKPLADVAAFSAWIGETLDVVDPRALAVLDHASSFVRIAAGQTWPLAPAEVPDGLAQLTVRIAARGWINPSGNSTETTGPFSVSYRAMELTADERLFVFNTVNPGARRGLGTISTTRGCIETGNLIGVLPAGEPIDIGREPI